MSAATTLPPERRLARPRISIVTLSIVAFLALSVASWSYVLFGTGDTLVELFSQESWSRARTFIGELAGVGSQVRPAFLQWEKWRHAIGLAYETLAMSVLAMGFAGIGVLLTFLLAARNVAMGELAASRSLAWRSLFFVTRSLYIFTRGIPELFWAMLIIFVLSPGILPGAVALGLHNFGILGRLSAEVVENADPRPARALRAAGAGTFQMLAYGVLPQALPQFLTYLLYRWEVVIRTTIVVGFVGAGGLGRDFRLAMSWFHYTDVALLLMCYLALVVGVDLLSAWLRKLAK
ncbi:MAG: ABC transporter permease subunit [Chloroflexi bacterium]|nr:ABC transporter permease subunit [Chloroflexota bacterium]